MELYEYKLTIKISYMYNTTKKQKMANRAIMCYLCRDANHVRIQSMSQTTTNTINSVQTKMKETPKIPDKIPDGWQGPFEGMYLWREIPTLKKKMGLGLFKTLPEAIRAAETHGDECGGVVGGYFPGLNGEYGYTLRRGNDPMTDNTPGSRYGPFTCWRKWDSKTHKKREKDRIG